MNNLPAIPALEWDALARVVDDGGEGLGLLEGVLFTGDLQLAALKVLRDLRAMGRPIDRATMLQALRDQPEVFPLLNEAPGTSLECTLPELRAKAALREWQRQANDQRARIADLDARAYVTPQELADAIASARRNLSDASAIVSQGQRMDGVGMAKAFLDAWQQGPTPAISTGIHTLDRGFNGGLRGGRVVVVAARTSVGKSAFACWLTVQALKQGKRVLYVSREMPWVDVYGRLLSIVSGIPCNPGNPPDARHRAAGDGLAWMKEQPLFIRDNLRTVGAIAAEAENTKADIVVADHVGILDAGLGTKASSYDRATAVSNQLRDLALDNGAAVVALCQINRAGVGNEDDRPGLHHLKGSGSNEEDAHAVLILHRLEWDGRESVLEVNCPKNRDGATFKANVVMECATFRFEEQRERPDLHAR